MARKKRGEDLADLPTDDEAQKRWKQFMRAVDSLEGKVDALNERIEALMELGETIVVALNEAADAGAPPDSLVGIFQQAKRVFGDILGEQRSKARRSSAQEATGS